ncbi:hypothetical protein BGX21_001326 [Mortierella sp. AD011]|nr:hypothetical protein BGX20_010262 [Mortierella sp. AD010]KAF9384333.1 hypothetical protein BGX21_001326 [Mortierella sp. AD011]
MEIDQRGNNAGPNGIGDTFSVTASPLDEHLGSTFPKKRPLLQDDPFFQEGVYEYKAAWLRLEDENAYIPDMIEDSETHARLTQPQTCHYDQCHGERTFSSAAAYEHHYETNHRHICLNCKKSFPGEKWLELHLHEIHDTLVKIKRERGEKTYRCFVDGCDRLCSAPDKRRRHLIDKHQYPKSFNFNIVVTGIIPFAERMKQLRREKALWKSREEGRQKVHHRHSDGSQLTDNQQQKQRPSGGQQGTDDPGAMEIEPAPKSTVATKLTLPHKNNNNRGGSSKSGPGTPESRSALGLPPKKNVFKQYRSQETGQQHTRSSAILNNAMETDTVPAPKSFETTSTNDTSRGQKDKLDMDIDFLQQSMARLMIPRSNASLRNGAQNGLLSHESVTSSTTLSNASNTINNGAASEVLGAIPTNLKKTRKRLKLDWSLEDDALLLELRTVQNKKWLEIGQRLNREPATCMNRFESTLNPALRDFWTPDRDKKLDELITSSKSWPDIAQILGVHRLACMERWRQLGLKELAQVDMMTPEGSRNKQKEKARQRQDLLQHLEIQQRINAQEQLKKVREMTANLKDVQQVDKDHDRLSWNSLLRDDERYSHYRSWKKKTRLDAYSQLYLMNPGWSAKEETILIQHVLKHGLDKWDLAAKEGLKGRVTAAQCRTCWKNLDMPVVTLMNNPDVNQQQQRAQLTDSATPMDTPESTTSPSGNQVNNITDRVFNCEEESAWTKDQQIQFWHLWNQHGQDWRSIAKAMGGNASMASCKKYFTDITEQFRHSGGGGQKDESQVQERIKTLAKTITQDFKRLPRRQSFSDGGESGAATGATRSGNKNLASDKTSAPASSSSRAPAFVWDKELSVRLQAIIRQAYKSRAIHLDEINWIWVSRRVHPDVTSRICKNHWKYLHDPNQAVWKHDDIKRLEEGVRLLGPKKLTQIRDHFLPHMSKDDITRHWFRISDKATIINEEEYYRLLGAVGDIMGDTTITATSSSITTVNSVDHGESSGQQTSQTEGGENSDDPQTHHWAEVEKRMGPGWKKLPCKRVWESSFQYLIRHTHWTSNEDTMLLRMVKFVGRDDWFTVSKAMQLGKSPWQCRLRWCQLLDPVDLDSSDLFVKGEKYC